MQANKIKRVRSAASFKQTRYSKVKASFKTQQNCLNYNNSHRSLNQILEKKQTLDSSNKQTQFKDIIKRISSSSSKISQRANKGFKQYNYQSWRTINSARSLNRLQSLKKCQQQDPIKLNLKQKVSRIKSKHSDNQIKFRATQSTRNENPQQKQIYKINSENDSVSSKIRQIIGKWQNAKIHSIDEYKKKVLLFFKNPVNRKKQEKRQQPIRWEIQ